MSSNSGIRRYLLLAGASSLAFLAWFLLILYDDGNDLVNALVGYTALLVFGSCVLVPHVPAQKRTPARVFVLVCLPVLASWLFVGVMDGLDSLLSDFSDIYFSDPVWMSFSAAAGIAWVLILANAVIPVSGLARSSRFWLYVSLVAAACGLCIFVAGTIFQDCFLRSCAQWKDLTLVVSVALLFLGGPPALTTALCFGISKPERLS